MGLINVSLDDKYTIEHGRLFMNGTQALVRLMLMQHAKDKARGLKTAGYVSGYRGSPLGKLDQEFGRAAKYLAAAEVLFRPAVNEDMAATAVWGTQQTGLYDDATHDGVFGVWYGKGPGVDRSGDVFRHANLAGTSPTGGVLALAGDDPGCNSSTVPSHSEYALIDGSLPFLHPANLSELLRYGLMGIEMSRFSGLWVGMKCITDTMDTAGSLEVDPSFGAFVLPDHGTYPEGERSIRWPDRAMDQEERLHALKIPAAIAFARVNKLDQVIYDSPQATFGICATGKTFMDVQQALDDLGIDAARAAKLGLRVYKIAMPWPLEPEGAHAFADGLSDILVVEEKRPVIETQLKDLMYNRPSETRPNIVGKRDETGAPLLLPSGELTPGQIARIIAARIARYADDAELQARAEAVAVSEKNSGRDRPDVKRIPYFCSGCPHNTSTQVPEGSRAAAGIGCHYLALVMDRNTITFTQMGGEGGSWIGQAPFCKTGHIFVNIGDGTYYHSGVMAIRAAIASGVNVTYKVLYNDAVAMTGGQSVDGPLSPMMIAQQMLAEGANRVTVVAEDPSQYPPHAGFPAGVAIHPREELDAVQRELRDVPGVSILIYDQTCAAEKRRRRKRGQHPDPDRRVFINEDVCEGCGDCGQQSNCVSITPVETELGRKRRIDQSSCNKDFRCLDGFCPSFVTIDGAAPRKPKPSQDVPFPALPDPDLPSVETPYSIVVTGIGGTGVVTVSTILAMAGHIEGKGATALDVAGLSQKNGMVYSHLRFAKSPDDIKAVRIATGRADALLGCDMVTACDADNLSKLAPGKSRAAVNAHRTMTTDFTRDPDTAFPEDGFKAALTEATGGTIDFPDVTALALGLLGDAIGANMMLVGFAYQKGMLPVSAEAIEQALRLNGVAVDFNIAAFTWGRRAAFEPALVAKQTGLTDAPETFDLDAFIARRIEDLSAYQNAAYAERYKGGIERIRAAEAAAVPGSTALTETAARALFKLMAYKDEYEVARLYTDGRFKKRLRQAFEDGGKISFHLAPPLMAERDPISGHLKKRTYGPWMLSAFKLMARLKGLRGTAFDPFGRTEERKMERHLITEYEAQLSDICANLTASNVTPATALAAYPLTIRGFGHVKEANVAKVKSQLPDLIDAFRNPDRVGQAAE